jgi:hypothetical protein
LILHGSALLNHTNSELTMNISNAASPRPVVNDDPAEPGGRMYRSLPGRRKALFAGLSDPQRPAGDQPEAVRRLGRAVKNAGDAQPSVTSDASQPLATEQAPLLSPRQATGVPLIRSGMGSGAGPRPAGSELSAARQMRLPKPPGQISVIDRLPASALADLDRVLQTQRQLAHQVDLIDNLGMLQVPARQDQVFTLGRENGKYAFNAMPGTSDGKLPPVEGHFDFVVLAGRPDRILLGYNSRNNLDEGPVYKRFAVEGHTSLTGGDDVLYAGQMEFHDGELLNWDSGSGHYQPAPAHRHTNLPVALKDLLPEKLYLSYWDADGERPMSLAIGETKVAVGDLHRMGAVLDGMPVQQALDAGAATRPGLADRIQIDGARLAHWVKLHSTTALSRMLTDIGMARTIDTPLISPRALTRPAGGDQAEWLIGRMNRHVAEVKGLSREAAGEHQASLLKALRENNTALAKRVLTKLSPASQSALVAVLKEQENLALQLQPLEKIDLVESDHQKQFTLDNLFELGRQDDRYMLSPAHAGVDDVPSVDGKFLFVVTQSEPDRIVVVPDMVVIPEGQTRGNVLGVGGHASMAQGKEVLFAGEMTFQDGKMISWNNRSRDFSPPAQLRHFNISPSLKHLLFEQQFEADSAKAPSTQATIKIGQVDMLLDDLTVAGAVIDGQPIAQAIERGAALRPGLADRIQFDGGVISAWVQRGQHEGVVAMLSDIAIARKTDVALVKQPATLPGAGMSQQKVLRDIREMNEYVQKLRQIIAAASPTKSTGPDVVTGSVLHEAVAHPTGDGRGPAVATSSDNTGVAQEPGPPAGDAARPAGEAPNASLSKGAKPSQKASTPVPLDGVGQVDDLLSVGKHHLNVATLAAMGATVDGVPIRRAMAQGLAGRAGILDRLQVEGADLARMFKSGRTDEVLSTLMEAASARGGNAPLIMPDKSHSWIGTMNQQLEGLKGIDARSTQSSSGNPITFLSAGGRTVQHVGVGLQIFGIYTALRGTSEAVARGDKVGAAVNVAALAAEAGSVGLEAGLPRLAANLGRGQIELFNDFARTPLGIRLGGQVKIAARVGQMASVAGAALAVPFEVYNAVDSFQRAGSASGKQQQDLYVNGGFAVAGATASVALAGAAVAGAAFAGPVGLAVGGVLAVGQNMYNSVRYVEDIERYVPLSHGERFETGLASFFGGNASQSIQDKVSVGQAREQYRDNKRDELLSYLKKSTHKQAIFGDAIIRAQEPIERMESRLVLAAGGPYTSKNKVKTFEQRPASVRDNAGDDDIDASAGLQRVSNLVKAPQGAETSVLWVTGEGRDRLKGALNVSNVFDVREGEKNITGGPKDDRFDLVQRPSDGSVLNGGDGQDTLALHFSSEAGVAPKGRKDLVTPDVHVVLPARAKEGDTAGSTFLPRPGGLYVKGERAELLNIDHIVTSSTARTRVTGNQNQNLIVLNGDGDKAAGGGGNDIFVINGGGRVSIVAGTGNNRYVVGNGSGHVDIDNANATGGRHHVRLNVDIGDMSVMAAGSTLEIRLGKRQPDRRVVLSHIFEQNEQGRNSPRLADDDIVISTRDGYVVTPTLSSIGEYPDGLIALVAEKRTTA